MDTIPDAALEILREYEDLSLKAYLDPADVPTIGYGYTGQVHGIPVRLGMTITREEAENLLRTQATDLASRIRAAARHPETNAPIHLTTGQLAALTSFVYNVGWWALQHSDLWRLVRERRMAEAARQFARWTWAGNPKREIPELVRRRAAESDLFLSDS